MGARSVNCPSCGAAISDDSMQCRYCRSLLQTVACPSCFGMMFKGSRFCPHCGAKTDAGAVPAEGAHHCPCCRVDLGGIVVGGTPMEQCPRCGGLWVDVSTFERICSDRESQTAAMGIRLPPPLPPEQGARYRKCPRCGKLMGRKNYARRSGVIMDICRPHGIWLDRDELRRIIEFIRAGGLDVARQFEKEQLERERQQLEAQRRMMPPGDTNWSSSGPTEVYVAGEVLRGLGMLLRGLLR